MTIYLVTFCAIYFIAQGIVVLVLRFNRFTSEDIADIPSSEMVEE